jgi:hypothetical protein
VELKYCVTRRDIVAQAFVVDAPVSPSRPASHGMRARSMFELDRSSCEDATFIENKNLVATKYVVASRAVRVDGEDRRCKNSVRERSRAKNLYAACRAAKAP